MKKFFMLFLMSLFLMSILSVGVNAQGGGDDEFKISGVFKPITELVAGLMETITGEDNADIWLRLAIGILIFAIIYAASNLIPVLKDNEAMKAVVAIALAIATIIIFKASFFATILGAYFMYGLALLMGFTLLGTVYLCWTVYNHDKLKVDSRVFNAIRYLLPALILFMFVGLVSNLGDAMASPDMFMKFKVFGLEEGAAAGGAGAGAAAAGAAPEWVTELMNYGVAILQLAITLLVILGLVALAGFMPGAFKRTYHWAAGQKLLERDREQLEALFNTAEKVRDEPNAENIRKLKTYTRRWFNSYHERFIKQVEGHGIRLPADVKALGRKIAREVNDLTEANAAANIGSIITDIQGLTMILNRMKFTAPPTPTTPT